MGTVVLPDNQEYFLMLGATSYLLNVVGDMAVDWGLLRVWKGDKKFLRSQIKLSHKFYYTVILVNLVLRLAWLATLIPHNKI